MEILLELWNVERASYGKFARTMEMTSLLEQTEVAIDNHLNGNSEKIITLIEAYGNLANNPAVDVVQALETQTLRLKQRDKYLETMISDIAKLQTRVSELELEREWKSENSNDDKLELLIKEKELLEIDLSLFQLQVEHLESLRVPIC